MVVGLKHEMSVESGAGSISTGAEEEEEPAPIPLLDDDMTAMQIAC